jgi:hypothetical protein
MTQQDLYLGFRITVKHKITGKPAKIAGLPADKKVSIGIALKKIYNYA